MKRTLVIGDIHGGFHALKQVFVRAKVTSEDLLIFLGDYVDGWSQSPDVLEMLIGLEQTHNCIFIRGNHDDLLLDWLRGKTNDLWLQHGGNVTISNYANLDDATKKKHELFLDGLQNYYLDEKNRLFVHAGFTSWHGVTREHYPRLLFWDRTLWETALALDETLSPDDNSYPRRMKQYAEIFIGHTPVTRIGRTVPVNRGNVWNIDTGSAFQGPLTVMDVESKQFWQSDPLHELYPNENGRN